MGNYHAPFWRAAERATSLLTLILYRKSDVTNSQSFCTNIVPLDSTLKDKPFSVVNEGKSVNVQIIIHSVMGSGFVGDFTFSEWLSASTPDGDNTTWTMTNTGSNRLAFKNNAWPRSNNFKPKQNNGVWMFSDGGLFSNDENQFIFIPTPFDWT